MRRLALIALGATIALLAGCTAFPPAPPAGPSSPSTNGVDELSAAVILTRAAGALSGARSFHITSDHTKPGGPLSVDEVDAGDNVVRTLRFPTVTTVVIAVGGTHYLKLTDDELQAILRLRPGATLTAFAGKYLVWTGSEPPVPELAGQDRYADIVKAQLSSAGSVVKGRTVTVGGQPAIELVRTSDQTLIDVALVGEPYPLRIEVGWPAGTTVHPGGPLAVYDISAFNQGQRVEAPAPADRVDLNQLLSAAVGTG